MKTHVRDLFLALSLLARLPANGAEAVQHLALDPLAVARIPVAMDRLTTIRFPAPISDLDAAFIGTEADPPALFQLSFRPGSDFFSVRALAPNTNATLNIGWKQRTYVLELVATNRPWLSVVFETPAPALGGRAGQIATPSRLLGLLDLAKAYPLLKQQHPGVVAGIECVRPNTTHDYGDYTIRIEEVFDMADTLVFRIVMANKTSQTIRYAPQSLMVRVGTTVLYQSITDATGELRPHSAVPVYFAVTSGTNGGRSGISPNNEFMVLINRTASAALIIGSAVNRAQQK